MPVVVVTRTRMARARYLPLFARDSLRAGLQARRSAGYVAGALGVARGPEFWTITVWEDVRAMGAYRDSGAHAEVMPRLTGWAKDGSFTVWQTGDHALPSWEEVRRRVGDSQHFVPLDHPTPEYAAGVRRLAPRRSLRFRVPGPVRPMSSGKASGQHAS